MRARPGRAHRVGRRRCVSLLLRAPYEGAHELGGCWGCCGGATDAACA